MSLAAPLVAVSLGLAGCGSDEPKVPTNSPLPTTTTTDSQIVSNPPPARPAG